jgi:hypothetical protein
MHRLAFASLEDVRKVFFVPLLRPQINLAPLKHPIAFTIGLGGDFKFSEGRGAKMKVLILDCSALAARGRGGHAPED